MSERTSALLIGIGLLILLGALLWDKKGVYLLAASVTIVLVIAARAATTLSR